METLQLMPADPERHFSAIASLMNTQETEPNSADTLMEWYNKHRQEGVGYTVALSDDKVVGYSSLFRASTNRERYYHLDLIVEPSMRGCGLGSLMYDDLLSHAYQVEARTLKARLRDNTSEAMRFATQRGFVMKKHTIEMKFDLKGWDEARYAPILDSLHEQGFTFTNMAELGDTADARRKLFTLNNEAAATDPGSDGIPPWASFEEFEKDVCSSSWYHPDAQIVAIDSQTGDWAAMSAITVFEGADHAYNLFTGTDVRYRGRQLAQAVKSLALRRARAFGVETVRTSHNSENEAMIAIDTKLGYVRTPGMYSMEKQLEE